MTLSDRIRPGALGTTLTKGARVMTKMAERIAEDGITAIATAMEASRDPQWRSSDRWSVLLQRGEALLSVEFHTGSGLRSDTAVGVPAAWVLSSLCSDAAGVLNADGFEDWAQEYGYDTDSRAAEQTYRACVEQTDTLRNFLGELFDAYVWETESE